MADKIDIIIADKINAGIRRKILNIGRAAKIAHTQIELLKTALNIRTSNVGITKLTNDMRQATVSTTRFNGALRLLGGTLAFVGNRLRALGARLVGFRARMASVARSTRVGVSTLRSYLSLAALVGAGGAIKAADNYRIMQNQLRGVSENQGQLNVLMDELFNIANRSRVPVASLTKSFRRFDLALKDMGLSQQDTLEMTETLAKALSLSGATAGESAAGLLQLSQAFNNAKLNGDEFRSVGELMPVVLRAIMKTTGATRGELNKMAEEGEITSAVLFRAMKVVSDEIKIMFEETTKTVGQSFTVMLNKIVQAFGKWDARTGFLDRIIKGIDWMGNNLPKVVQYLKAFGVALALIASPFIATALLYIAGFFLTPLGWIVGIAGYLTLFADKIIVVKGELTNLQDAFFAFFQKIGPFVHRAASALLGLSGSLATPQQIFDKTLVVLKSLISNIVYMVAAIRSFYAAWNTLDWAAVWLIAKETIGKFFLQIEIWILKLVQTVFDAFGKMMQPIADFLLIGKRFGAAFKSVLAAGERDITRLEEKLNTWSDTASNAGDVFDETFDRVQQSMQAAVDAFGSDVLGAAHENMLIRMGINWERSWREWVNVAINAINQVITALNGITGLSIGQLPTLDVTAGLRGAKNTIEEYQAALDAAAASQQKLATGGNASFNQLGNSVQNFGQQSQSVLGSVFGNIQNALTQFVRTGKLDFKELMRSILADLLKLFTNKLFQQLIGGIGGGGGGGGGLFGGGGGGLFGGGGGFFGGGGFLGALFGFAKGGYTGNGGTGSVAGVVHGQEFVMPAGATKRNRPALEAMRNGASMSSSYGNSKGMTVKINNYANATVETTQNRDGELEITMRQIAEETVAERAPRIIATNLRNSNSRESKALGQSTRIKRRRA